MNEVDGLFRSAVGGSRILADLFRQEQSPAERSAALAGVLRTFFPMARLTACRLDGTTGSFLAVLPTGQTLVEVEKLRLLTIEKDSTRRLFSEDLSANLAAVAAAIPGETDAAGLIFVGLPANAHELLADSAEGMLALAASAIGLHLRTEVQLRECREEMAEQADMVMVGDAMFGLTHDLRNSLNTMMLQAAVVQLKVPPSLREDLTPIRREGAAAAARLQLLQQFRAANRGQQGPIDLHEMLRQAVAAIAELAGRVRWQLDDELRTIRAPRPALSRLLLLLLRLAADNLKTADGSVRIQSSQQDGTIRVVLEPVAERLPADNLAEVFASSRSGDESRRMLEGIAAESLARATTSGTRVESGPDGLAVVLQWTADAADGLRP